MGIRARVSGQRPAHAAPVVFVVNHSSWLDIPLLGANFYACFVSKDDVRRWPGISIVAKLGRTVFVSRGRGNVARERGDMQARLARGDNLILFPEGTSSDSARVLPFRSSFFSLAEGVQAPVVQPVSVAYDLLDGLPVLHGNRAMIGWYGDMDLFPHLWRIAGHASVGASIRLHPPLNAQQDNRKTLAQKTWNIVASAAAKQRRHSQEV